MAENGRSMYIDVDDIKIDDMQSRMGHWEDDEQDEALVDSMKGIGQIQEVIVRPVTNSNEKFKYSLVAGSRRYHAIIKAGKSKIRAIVKEMTDIESLEISISENAGRKDLTMFEQAIAFTKLKELLMDENKIESYESEKLIAEKILGATSDNLESKRSYVSRILRRIENIPEQALVLMKEPQERTDAEKQVLKKYGIPFDYSGSKQKVTDALSSLSIHLNGISDEDKADKLLTMFSELHLYSRILTEEDVKKRVIKLRDLIKEGNPFNIAMHKMQEEERKFEIQRAYNIPSFHLPSQKYWEWHGKAVEHSRMQPTDLVQKVYIDWLEKLAKKEGWYD